MDIAVVRLFLALAIGAAVILIILVIRQNKIVMRKTTPRDMYDSERKHFGAHKCPFCEQELQVLVYADEVEADWSKRDQVFLVCPPHKFRKVVVAPKYLQN